MFSRYFNTNFGQNHLILKKDELQRQGFEIFDLSESNPTKCGFDYSFLKNEKIFCHGNNILYQPDPKGLSAVREKITEYYNLRNINSSFKKINPENLFLTSGTSESYSHIFKLLCNPEDVILIPKPGYPLFEILAGINYIDYKHYRLIYEGNWKIDFNSLENAVTNKVKAIIIVNPNNPTGNYLSQQEMQILSRICSKHGISVICDEVFYDYNLIPLTGTANLMNPVFDFPVFILNGLSKISAAPQFKLGWILVNSPVRYLKKINDGLEIICDTYLSVNCIIQNSFKEVFGFREIIQEQIKKRIRNNLALLKLIFPDSRNTDGGWNTIVELPAGYDEEKFSEELLDKEKIFIHPGYFYDFEEGNKIVLSLIVPEDIFLTGLKGIKNFR